MRTAYAAAVNVVPVSLAYFASCSAFMPLQEAGSTAAIFLVSCLGILALTESKNLVSAFHWFPKHPLRGLFVVGATSAVVVIGLHFSVPVAKVLSQTPVSFACFWAFAAMGSYLEARRVQRLVAAELARGPSQGGERVGPRVP